MKVYLLSLGCAKNQVDAEIMSQLLRDAGHVMVDRPDQAACLIVNTCGFIQEAKEEAIQHILELADWKKKEARYLLVTGCLSQRYATEIYQELPEVDLALGTAEYGEIAQRLAALERGHSPGPSLPRSAGGIAHLETMRRSTSAVYAYIKIAEGCSEHCTYCAIPGIRGPQRSRPLEKLVEEARHHLARGVQELILIAQDSAAYGLDLYGEARLADLLVALDGLDGAFRLRLLYLYPSRITPTLLETMAGLRHLARYLDMPIQHGSDSVLKRMGRPETAALIRQTVALVRQTLPGVTLRSTVLVGFPGETEADFQALLALLEAVRFERLGCFVYSEEEGTAAERLLPKVARETAERRALLVRKRAREILIETQRAQLGRSLSVLLEQPAADGVCWEARSDRECPDVDPPILVYATEANVQPGRRTNVRIVDFDDDTLIGVMHHEPAK